MTDLLDKFKSTGRRAPLNPVRQERPFAMVPIELAVSMSAAARCPRAMLLIWMFYLAWKAKTRGEDTFVLANCDLERMGVSREVKREVLLDLETAGLIRVERQCPRAPRIQILGAGWCAGGNL